MRWASPVRTEMSHASKREVLSGVWVLVIEERRRLGSNRFVRVRTLTSFPTLNKRTMNKPQLLVS